MLTPERVLRLMIEVIFLLLGVLVVWLALSGRILRRAPQTILAHPQRCADPLGTACPLRPQQIVGPLGELDSRAFVDSPWRGNAGHFESPVFVGRTATGHRRSIDVLARNHRCRACLPAALIFADTFPT